jgi:hypothetical protein
MLIFILAHVECVSNNYYSCFQTPGAVNAT